MSVSLLVFGSYTARCRLARSIGKSRAEGFVDPALQKAGFSGGRTVEVIQTRPLPSNIGLWTLFLLVQIASSPQNLDGFGMVGSAAGFVFGSLTVNGTRLAVLRLESRTGR